MHVCELCAQQQGLTVKSHISLNELLSGLLAAQPAGDEIFGELDEETACPRCGFTLEDFRRTGLLGCPDDYQFFEKALIPLIEKAHDGASNHCGKVPHRLDSHARNENRLWILRRRLDEAVRAEDYEKAAVLRDEIEKLGAAGESR
jgi:protein arginine kinase activator